MFLPPVRQTVSLHQHASLRVVADCGHVVNVEEPQIFNDLAVSFISQHPVAG
jgi:pimeloyl-ACP methyl ester carboxylesterase